MPSLDIYKSIISARSSGEAKKMESDQIMNETWWEDISSRVAYLYDFYHDDEPLTLRNLHPQKSKVKTCVDIKFLQSASQTFEKDAVTTHVQLRPGQGCNVDYYKEAFEDRYGAIWPVGLYIDIEDEAGQYNRWLVVQRANFHNVLQFPTYEVLPCDKVLQYVIDGIKYQVPGVLRSQNSYNSGLWLDLKKSPIIEI